MSLHLYSHHKRIGNEQLVREVDRKRHRELLLVALTASALALAVLGYAWQHFEMIRIGYRMEELRVQREHLLKIHRQLALEKAALSSPDRVERVAIRRLGMTYPSASKVVVIEPYRVGGFHRAMEGEPSESSIQRDRPVTGQPSK